MDIISINIFKVNIMIDWKMERGFEKIVVRSLILNALFIKTSRFLIARTTISFARTSGDIRGKTVVNRPEPIGCGEGSVWALLSAALDKGSGLRWRVQSLAQCPWSDYLRGLNSIVHANFITTTLAPMGAHRLREPERWAALRWKGRNEAKAAWAHLLEQR